MLLHCELGVQQYLNIFKELEEEVLKPGNSIFKLEDTLLSLASKNSIDGIYFYIAFELSDSTTTSRQFEAGCFELFSEHCKCKIGITVGYKCEAPVNVYTREDISMEKERNTELYKERTKSGIFLCMMKTCKVNMTVTKTVTSDQRQ